MNTAPVTATTVLKDLQALADPAAVAGMARFKIVPEHALGIKIPVLRNYAKPHRGNHPLALALWETGIHEARLLAVFIADPKQVTEDLMEQWVQDFNSWDICDQACGTLFDKTPNAYSKAMEWAQREPEFQKRAGFAMMAMLAVHDKRAPDEKYLQFFPLLEQEAHDNRNFVKKALNWAIRQIGKRNYALNKQAIALADRLKLQNSKSANWIAADALRELQDEKFQAKLNMK